MYLCHQRYLILKRNNISIRKWNGFWSNKMREFMVLFCLYTKERKRPFGTHFGIIRWFSSNIFWPMLWLVKQRVRSHRCQFDSECLSTKTKLWNAMHLTHNHVNVGIKNKQMSKMDWIHFRIFLFILVLVFKLPCRKVEFSFYDKIVQWKS